MGTSEGPTGGEKLPRHHIGPALRDLRTRRGWTLKELARRSGISESYLGRLERGISTPSITVLSQLAAVFEVQITYFTTFEQTSRELKGELREYLEALALPRGTWREFFGLSLEAQGALLDALRRLTPAEDETASRARALETTILSQGLAASIPRIQAAITEFGMGPADFLRAMTQVEELPGERLRIADRLSVIDVSHISEFDQLQIYRGLFASDPPDPLLLKWWTKTQRTALAETLRQHECRTILSLQKTADYLRTGRWGSSPVFPRDVVRGHVRALIGLLRGSGRYRIGLIDTALPFNVLIKGSSQTLVYGLTDDYRQGPTLQRVALRFSRPDLTSLFREYFEELWASIPEERKDPEAVATWFEAEVGAIGSSS